MNGAAVAGLLRCPLCGGRLEVDGAALRCGDGHSYDIARNGSATLAGGEGLPPGDTAEMLAARDRLLGSGSFAPIVGALTASVAGLDRPPGVIADCGAGTGWYLARVLDAVPGAVGLALDCSAPATRLAARVHERAFAVRCDVWRGLPLGDRTADLVLCVFSPRAGAHFERVLTDGGVLIVVTPTPRHLGELDLIGVEPAKRERLERTVAPLRTRSVESIEWEISLDAGVARDLVAMGPNAHHDRDPGEAPRRVTASVELTVFGR